MLFTTREIYNATSLVYQDLPHEVVLYGRINLLDFFNMKKKIISLNIDNTIFSTMQSKFIEFMAYTLLCMRGFFCDV